MKLVQNPYYESTRNAIHNIELFISPTACEPHYHQSVEILYAPDCEVNVLVNGEERILHAGEICVADCYDVHSFHSHEKNVMIMIIPPEYLSDYLNVRGKQHLSTPFPQDKGICKKIAEAMGEFAKIQDSPLSEKGYVNVIMGLLVRGCELKNYADSDIGLMQSILNYLEENCNEEINLISLSAKFGYSKYYFSRMFNQFFKYGLNEYLAQIRIRRFLERMQSDRKADLIGTALDCGFNSFQTFYRCFKKYYGVPPKKYLKNL